MDSLPKDEDGEFDLARYNVETTVGSTRGSDNALLLIYWSSHCCQSGKRWRGPTRLRIMRLMRCFAKAKELGKIRLQDLNSVRAKYDRGGIDEEFRDLLIAYIASHHGPDSKFVQNIETSL